MTKNLASSSLIKQLLNIPCVQFGGVEGVKLPSVPLHMKVSPLLTANPLAHAYTTAVSGRNGEGKV